jgi:predicted RNA polymerase sigma factor
MKHFTTPRTDAADLIAFFRARAVDRMRRSADRTAWFRRRRERENAHRSMSAPPLSSCWILHAR